MTKVNVKRLKSITVDTPSGKKTITMVPVLVNFDEDKIAITDTFCSTCCPYGSICGKLKDPRDPNNGKTLTDWCNEISFTDDSLENTNDYAIMHPMEGEIERLYDEESSPFKQLLQLNPVVNLNTFIDNVCPGFCDKYNKDHSNCGLDNDFCICRGLFVRKLNTSYLNGNDSNSES